jgi:hypothetical protein
MSLTFLYGVLYITTGSLLVLLVLLSILPESLFSLVFAIFSFIWLFLIIVTHDIYG